VVKSGAEARQAGMEEGGKRLTWTSFRYTKDVEQTERRKWNRRLVT
jgi:hypothetical protein